MQRPGADKESASLATAGSVPDLSGKGEQKPSQDNRPQNQLLTRRLPAPLPNSVTAS
jgi:hypothetical protein